MWITGLVWNIWLTVAVVRYPVAYDWYPQFHCAFMVQPHRGFLVWQRDRRTNMVLCWQESVFTDTHP